MRHWNKLGILFLLLLWGCGKSDLPMNTPFQLQIENKDGTTIQISSWINEEGEHYLFLPSFCELSDLKFDSRKLNIVQSEHVASLFINTESGSMDAIHQDKNYRESVEVALYTADGELNHSTTKASLKGRGNTTWELFDKKPYQLKLDTAADLLEMGAGKKWILLANAFDETNLRNKLIFDIARENDFVYAPESQFVDLYLNGEYRGLYLLAERVEFGKERLNVEADEKYMCNFELAVRWDSLDNAFLTEFGRAVEVREPDKPTNEEFERISEIVQQMENAILEPNENLILSDVIDLDSWVYKYLFDEIMENGDADIASSYFYYANGKIYAGPLWDYDNTLGVSTRNQNPSTFLAKSEYTYVNHGTPYHDALYEREEFYERMVELYQKTMLPVIQLKLQEGLREEEKFILKATEMNCIRWAKAFEEQNAEITNAEGIIDYLEKRIAFLNTAWLEGMEYYTIQFEPYVLDMYATEESSAGSYAVKAGECFTEYAVVEQAAKENAVWIDYETGEIFDPNQAITRNMTLILKRE